MPGLADKLGTNLQSGLASEDVVAASRGRYGANTYKQVPPKSFFAILFEGFKDPVILLLCAAATVSAMPCTHACGPLAVAPAPAAGMHAVACAAVAVSRWAPHAPHACMHACCTLALRSAQLSTVLGAAIPEERLERKWIEGVAIWVAIFLVTTVGA